MPLRLYSLRFSGWTLAFMVYVRLCPGRGEAVLTAFTVHVTPFMAEYCECRCHAQRVHAVFILF